MRRPACLNIKLSKDQYSTGQKEEQADVKNKYRVDWTYLESVGRLYPRISRV